LIAIALKIDCYIISSPKYKSMGVAYIWRYL